MPTLSERKAMVARLPWVKRINPLAPQIRCEAYRWSHMPGKAVWGPDAAELKKKYQCKNRAFWTFRSLRKSYARSGRYCWCHLIGQLHNDQYEIDRTTKKIEQLLLSDAAERNAVR